MSRAQPARSASPISDGASGVLRVSMTVEQCWHRVPGGTATSILGLCAALGRRDDVDVIGVAARHDAPPTAGFEPPVEVRHLRWSQRALYLGWSTVGRPSVDALVGDADVVHATAVAIPPTVRPLVVTIHDLAFLAHPEHATRWGRFFFRRGLAKTIAAARLVACPSQATVDECLAAGIEAERLRVVPWGLDWEPADDSSVQAIRSRHELPERFVLWVGTIEPRKNLPGLLAAYRWLARPEIPLVLVGPQGWHEVVPDGEPGVRVLGQVPHADLRALYRAATVLCYPSLREGFGLPVLEAMSQATPVVTSAGTATAEVAGDAALLIDPHDPAAIGAALAEILDDSLAAAELGAAGRRRADIFTWDAAAAAMTDVYREAAR